MENVNWLDRAISFIAPQKAEQRVAARARIARASRIKSLYEGAAVGRRTSGWRSVGTDINQENRLALGRLRDVSRDMVRNNAYASRAKATIAHNVVGTGILARVKANTPKRAEQIKALLDRHFDTTDIDADGRLNLYGLQSLAMSTIVESGEVLIRKRIRRPSDGGALPFQIQVLEPDFIDTNIEGQQPNGNYAVQGVEFDWLGKRVAYFLFDEHPGSMVMGRRTTKSQRVSADFVAHVFRVDRPGQVRGVSWFAPVMVRMKDFAEYTDAQLMRQKISACFAAFITSNGEDNAALLALDGSDANLNSPYPIEQFEPGMIERLRDGESVSFAQPPTTQDFGPYAAVTLHEIAAGLNITYEVFTGDLTGVNYSSGRMGWLEYQRSIEAWRWNMLIPQMLDPLAAWTLEAAQVVTGSSEPFFLAWTPPRREMIDPDTELKAASTAVRNGLSPLSEELRKLGSDPDEVFAALKSDQVKIDELGLVLDSDPRFMTLRGVQQKTADPNAPDEVSK